jgi:HlyD family secretion protein
MKLFKAPLSGLFALAIISVAIFIWIQWDRAERQSSQGRWVGVASEPIINELTFVGKVIPSRTFELVSPATGVLRSLSATVGDAVTKGQQLGLIESHELESQLRAAEIAEIRNLAENSPLGSNDDHVEVVYAQRRMLAARTALQAALSRQRDSQTLYDKGFVSRNEHESANSEVANAELQALQATEEVNANNRKFGDKYRKATQLEAVNKRAELEQLRQKHSQLSLRAPFAGVLIHQIEKQSEKPPKALSVGSRVAAGDVVFVIGDTSALLVSGKASEADLNWLSVDVEAQVGLTSHPDQLLSGKVVKVKQDQVREALGQRGEDNTYEVLVSLPAGAVIAQTLGQQQIRIGSSAKVKIQKSSNITSSAIPIAAVVWSAKGEAQVLWRAKPADKPQYKTLNVVRADVNLVFSRDNLTGEVWVPSTVIVKKTTRSVLQRLLDPDE